MKFITEINKIKKLINIFENKLGFNTTIIIGDKIAYYLNEKMTTSYSDLVDINMSFDQLLDRLFKFNDVDEEVANVFISIGSEDFFDTNLDVSSLITKLDEIFPNANMFLIKGYIDAIEYNLDEKNCDLLEDNSISFFKLFELDRIQVIGKHSVIGYGVLERNSDIIFDLNEIIDSYEEDIYIDKEDDKKNNFSDLNIDEDSDFDTIYEFLANLEKMIKSKNEYSIDLKDRYLGDVELIQIALKFLGATFSESIEINGKYDDKTKRSVEEYQNKKGLQKTGVVDSETLEELLYELKVKSFDDEDIAKYMGKLDVEIKKYKIDDYDLEELCDRIINNIEGGYANESHFMSAANNEKNSDIKQALLNSGETMFGIDRKNGPTMTEFWKVVDENSGWSDESADKEKWPHGHMGGDVEDELREYVYEWAIPTYEEFKNSKLDSEAKRLVDEDERLTVHLLYAVWNGVVFFNNFAKVINSAVSNGVTDRDELWKIALDSRKNNSNGAISNTAPKIEKIANM